MKSIIAAFCMLLVMAGCQPKVEEDNSANEAFERNSKTVEDYLQAFQEGNVDYSIYADDFILLSHSVRSMQSMPDACELYAIYAGCI